MTVGAPERPSVPTCELGRSGPVSELEVLAAVARAEVHLTRHRPYLSDIANHLGWRYNGAATIRMRPHLRSLTDAGFLSTREPSPRWPRSQKWSVTDKGRRRLASGGPVPLPESPQHRRWRQDRDVAAWAIDAARVEFEEALAEAEALVTDEEQRSRLGESAVHRAIRKFESTLQAYALAIRMCEQWPEPSDSAADEMTNWVSRLLPEESKKRRRG